jgi:trigger factor
MKVDVQEISPVVRALRIEVPEEVVRKEFESAYLALNRRVQVPGFRPGKAPLAVLEKRYAPTVEEDVLRRLIPDFYQQAIKQSGLAPVELPAIEAVHLHRDEPLTFTARVEVRPKFELGTYRGLKLARQKLTVSDADLDKALDLLREQHAQLVACPPDHTAAQHDFALVDFTGESEGRPLPGGAGEGVTVEIGAHAVLPGFEEQLVGARSGERVEVRVTLPADYRQTEFAGKEARFDVTVREIKTKLLPALDDEFAKDLGHDSLATLKDKVRADLETRAAHEAARLNRAAAVKALVEAHQVDLPPSLIEREFQDALAQLAQRLPRGMTLEQANVDVEAFRREYQPAAESKVKGRLILEAIADQEKLDVGREEVDDALAKIAQEMHAGAEDVRRYLISRDGSLEPFRARLREDKALDLVYNGAVFE